MQKPPNLRLLTRNSEQRSRRLLPDTLELAQEGSPEQQ